MFVGQDPIEIRKDPIAELRLHVEIDNRLADVEQWSEEDLWIVPNVIGGL